jgi:polyferredoxin
MVTSIAAGFMEMAHVEPFSLFVSFIPFRIGGILYAAAFLLGAFCAGRIWCMYLCPVGAFLGLVSHNCFFPKKNVCKGCLILRSKDHIEGECMRCIQT